MKNKGFTLIELIVSVSLLAMLSVAATGLFFRAFRGTAKTATLRQVEQNSQFALEIMDRLIRNAQGIVSVGSGSCPGISDSLTILNVDGLETTLSLVVIGDASQVASNGAVISSSDVLISNLVFDCARRDGVPDKVTISFEAEQVDVSRAVSSSGVYTKVVSLRNY